MLSAVGQLSNHELLARVKHLAEREREATAALIAHLAELDERRLYLAEGCSSLFTYCTQVLRLSEHAAYGRIEAARMVRRFPVLLERLEEGSVNLTTVGLLAAHLTHENHRELLDMARHKRQPVSTPPRSSRPYYPRESAVAGRIVWRAILPAAPEHTDPCPREDADGMRMITPSDPGAFIDGGGPGRFVAGVIREDGDGFSEALVARPTKGDASVLARLVGHRDDARFRSQALCRGEAPAVIADLGEDLRRIELAGAGEGREDRSIHVCGDGVLDRSSQPLDLRDEGLEHTHQRTNELAIGLHLGLTHEAHRRAVEALQQLFGGAPATVGVVGEERLETPLAEVLGTLRCRVALQEGERDGRVDVGEDDPRHQARSAPGARAADWPAQSAGPRGHRACGRGRAVPASRPTAAGAGGSGDRPCAAGRPG